MMPDVLSVRFSNLVRLSVPLMIAAASESMMMFCDRVFLAHLSVDAMNTAAAVYINTALLICSLVAICAISEVIAGHHNGKNEEALVARPVWQILWFAGFCFCLTVPLAWWGKAYFVPASLLASSGHYFELMVLFAPVWGANIALAGFFAATGRPRVVTCTALAANLLNVGLDYVLVFGWGPVPGLGIDGAAWGTVLAQLSQFAFLLALFLRPYNRQRYGSGRPCWAPADLVACLKIGVPNAMSHGIEIAAWALLYRLLSSVSQDHLSVITVCQSLGMLFMFLNTGLKQGVIALASNCLGGRRYDDIPRLLQAGASFQLLIAMILVGPMLVAPQVLIGLLGDGYTGNAVLMGDLTIAMRLTWCFCLFDGLVWVLHGILTAGGDTKVPMLINTLSAWGLALVPAWYLLVVQGGRPWLAQLTLVSYCSGNCLLHYLRYRQGRWRDGVGEKAVSA